MLIVQAPTNYVAVMTVHCINNFIILSDVVIEHQVADLAAGALDRLANVFIHLILLVWISLFEQCVCYTSH